MSTFFWKYCKHFVSNRREGERKRKEMNLRGNERKKGRFTGCLPCFYTRMLCCFSSSSQTEWFPRYKLRCREAGIYNYQRLHYTAKIHFCESKVELLNSTERLTRLNPLTPKISLVILLTVFHIVLVMLVWRIWYWIN